ncbi:MAG: hypothetical protein M3R27_14365, partial [Bacteroidota bacterium]|nr:hypothetical protein [Bacteroidota bacterium]
VDTVPPGGVPTLKLTNTIIKNMQAAGLYGQGAHIWSNNCVFANCGQYAAALSIGGKYKFEHCTFANFWNQDERSTPLLALNNYYISSGGAYVIRDLDSAYFGNCILYGDLPEEIGLDQSTFGGVFSYKFDHCIVKTMRNTSNPFYYATCYQNNDPGFKNTEINDYRLNSATSFAVDKGDPGISLLIPRDLNFNLRGPLPDVGAYEYAP